MTPELPGSYGSLVSVTSLDGKRVALWFEDERKTITAVTVDCSGDIFEIPVGRHPAYTSESVSIKIMRR